MNRNNQDSIERDSAGFPYRALAMVLIAAALVCAVVGIFMLVDNGRHEVKVLTEPTTSTSVRTSTPAAEKKPPKVDKKAVRVVVLNNTTREGYAGRTADRLKQVGWTNMAEPTNCPEGACGSQSASTVFYKDTPEAKVAAEQVGQELGFKVAVRPAWLRSHQEDVVVVLAND